nr:hypothetical protein [bacterium]
KVLADLAAMAKKPAMPVAPVSAPSDDKEEMFDINSLKNFAPAAQVSSAAPAVPAATPVASITPVAPAASAEIMEVDLDALAKEEATAPVAPITPVTPIVKPVSEAAKIEAELEANTIDLDAELKEDGELPDLFESATPAAAKSPASAPSVETSDDLGASKLSKIKLTKTMGGEEKRVATVQKLMKTDTIYNRADKKELNLSSVSGDKKLKSPAEELAELTLEDWSRLGDIPSERAEKIKEKIAALGTKSIIDEVKGLNAWRSSQTHQAYLDLGVAAMLSEKGLDEIVSEQKALNLEEWLTINQLNRELMI